MFQEFATGLARRLAVAFAILTVAAIASTAQVAPAASAPQEAPGAHGTAPADSPTSQVSDSKQSSDAQQPGTTPKMADDKGGAGEQNGVGEQPTADQPTANDQAGMFVFKKEVEEVILHATVFDDQRRPVPNLDRSDFKVVENGVPQTITSFRRQDVPVAMGIVIDNSGSMRDKREEVNRAVLNLIRASNPQDEIFVVNFSLNPYLDQDYTSNVNLLQTALHQVSAAGSTALYDAIAASAIHLNNNPRLEKKVLLVITDGDDNMSRDTLQEALRGLQRKNGPTLYAIGLLGGDLEDQGRKALFELAKGTGGVAYFPNSLQQVNDITTTVAHDIRSQYMIAYKPENQNIKPDDRNVKVEAYAPGYGKLTVITRTGHQYSGEQHSGDHYHGDHSHGDQSSGDHSALTAQ